MFVFQHSNFGSMFNCFFNFNKNTKLRANLKKPLKMKKNLRKMSNLPLKTIKKWSGEVIWIFDQDHQKSDLRSDQDNDRDISKKVI